MTEKTFEEIIIYFVRHGQTDWNAEGRIQGSVDIHLNNDGKNEAVKCKDALKKQAVRIDEIVSSDLSRAKETAEIINADFGVSVMVDENLRERNAGQLEGKLQTKISRQTREQFNSDPEKIGVEPLEQVYERVRSFLDKKKDEEGNTLVVTHNGIIKMARYCIDHPEGFNQAEYKRDYAGRDTDNAEVVALDLGKMKRIIAGNTKVRKHCAEQKKKKTAPSLLLNVKQGKSR